LSAAWKEKVYSAKGTARKLWRRAPECKGGHVQWLLEIFNSKSVKVNFKPDEESMINVTTESNTGGLEDPG
jgi:hypothetical protein